MKDPKKPSSKKPVKDDGKMESIETAKGAGGQAFQLQDHRHFQESRRSFDDPENGWFGFFL
jgi:hypothetical protein